MYCENVSANPDNGRDNTQARVLQPDGTYLRLTPGDELPVNAQLALMMDSERNR